MKTNEIIEKRTWKTKGHKKGVTEKKCYGCKEIKKLTLFPKSARYSDGRKSECSECVRKRKKKAREEWSKKQRKNEVGRVQKWYRGLTGEKRKHVNEIKLQATQRYQQKLLEKNPELLWARKTYNSHARRKLTILMTIKENAELRKKTKACIYCGSMLNYRSTRDTPRNNTPSLDRINNEKILTKENCRIICHLCNTIKNDMTHDEFIEYCKHIALNF